MNKAATAQLSAVPLQLSTTVSAAAVGRNVASMVASLQRRIVQAYRSCLESSSSLD